MTSSAFVVVSSALQNKNLSLMSPELMYLTKTSYWKHELTSVDSSSWKENKGEAFISAKTCSFTSIDILEMRLCIVLFDRDTCCIFLHWLLQENIYYLHHAGFEKYFSTRVKLFLFSNFECSFFHMRPPLWLCRLKKSKSFFACSGRFVSRWRLSFDGFIDSALRTTWHKTRCGFSMSSAMDMWLTCWERQSGTHTHA